MKRIRGIVPATLVVAVVTSTSPHSTTLVAAPQAPPVTNTPLIRAGQIPSQLTPDDIAQINRLTPVLPRLPWLMLGELNFAGQWALQVYGGPDVIEDGVRRGRMMYVLTAGPRSSNPPRRWMTDPEWQSAWAQVTAGGRAPHDVTSEADVNRPFTVSDEFSSRALVEIVTLVRTSPRVQAAGQVRAVRGNLPVVRVAREDGSIRVHLRVDDRREEIVTVALTGDTWVATSVGDAIE